MDDEARTAIASRQTTVSVYEAAIMLGVSSLDIYDSIDCGEIYAVRVGSRWTIPTAELERLLKHSLAQEEIDWAMRVARIKYRTR